MTQEHPGASPGSASPRRGSRHATAVASLRTRIVSGEMASGVPLREQELCRHLGISRTPLREAIRTLAREGLVRLSPNRSAVVAPLDIDAVEDLYQAIGHIEALGARLACRHASDHDVGRLRVLHQEMLVSYGQGDLASYIAQNGRIHRAQLELSGNGVLVEIWEMLHPRVERARTASTLYPERWHAALMEHEAMLKALAARDEDALSSLMETHYANGLATLRRAKPMAPAAPPPPRPSRATRRRLLAPPPARPPR